MCVSIYVELVQLLELSLVADDKVNVVNFYSFSAYIVFLSQFVLLIAGAINAKVIIVKYYHCIFKQT